MSADLIFVLNNQEISDVELAEVVADIDRVGEGMPTKISARNTGDTVLRDIVVALDGEGALSVQLAVDVDGTPGEWAVPGGQILAASRLEPTQ